MQSELRWSRNPDQLSEPYSLSKLKIKKWIKPKKNTRFKNELQWVITLEFKNESAMPINPGNKSELMI